MKSNDLSIRIIDLREKQNITQTELAKQMDLDKSSMSKIENGTRKVSSDELSKLASIFNVSTDYLLGRKEPSNYPVDLDDAIDNAMSFDGRPVAEHDRQMMKQLWKAYMDNKD